MDYDFLNARFNNATPMTSVILLSVVPFTLFSAVLLHSASALAVAVTSADTISDSSQQWYYDSSFETPLSQQSINQDTPQRAIIVITASPISCVPC